MPISGDLLQRFRPTELQPGIDGFFPAAAAPGDAMTISRHDFDRLSRRSRAGSRRRLGSSSVMSSAG
jgi:hypothetical protein